jgi:hypothetical protein
MSLPPIKKKNGAPPPKRKEPAIPKRDIYRAAEQDLLFQTETKWEGEWKGMPEFVSKEMLPFHSINIHFENPAAMAEFSQLIGQKVIETTSAIWYPKKDILKVSHLRYRSNKP